MSDHDVAKPDHAWEKPILNLFQSTVTSSPEKVEAAGGSKLVTGYQYNGQYNKAPHTLPISNYPNQFETLVLRVECYRSKYPTIMSYSKNA